MSITKTFQDGMSSCMLACIESYLSDINIDITQQEMIEKLQPINLCDEKGYVRFENKFSVGKFFGLQLKSVEYNFPINDKYEDNSLFIGVDYSSIIPEEAKKDNSDRLHMVRYSQHINDKEFIIMDPVGWLGLRIWNKEDLDKVYKEFLYVSLMKSE